MNRDRKIYIADDSTVTRMFIINIIKNIENIKISEFANGEEVLLAIENETPDLLILDSVMPVMDGLNVLRRLKELNLNFPILFCTADIQITTKEKAMQLGINEFINKPIQKEIILDKVLSILKS
ncbi:MAG: hypothetical protein A2041_13740 [Bacteroidetes bacterium GWA2_31_9b]|nr:MAG: hypothetical protein A2041_13740 [Bacteroidetes bacterium GWA2_31_9b]